MRIPLLAILFLSLAVSVMGQSAPQKIYETERAFEKMVAEKGMNEAFIEYLTPDGIMFFPEVANAQEIYRSRPFSPALLTWNPILINVSSNDVLGYSIGNSIYKPKGKGDTTEFFGHYLSVWVRRPNGQYRAVLDAGINHDKPGSMPTEWKTTATAAPELNARGVSASDSSVGFYQTAAENVKKAFKDYLADDVVFMRDGVEPITGKAAAMKYLDKVPGLMVFGKRKSFVEAADLAYVHSQYTVNDKGGKVVERGNFVQVWRFRENRWRIVVDLLIPIPAK